MCSPPPQQCCLWPQGVSGAPEQTLGSFRHEQGPVRLPPGIRTNMTFQEASVSLENPEGAWEEGTQESKRKEEGSQAGDGDPAGDPSALPATTSDPRTRVHPSFFQHTTKKELRKGNPSQRRAVPCATCRLQDQTWKPRRISRSRGTWSWGSAAWTCHVLQARRPAVQTTLAHSGSQMFEEISRLQFRQQGREKVVAFHVFSKETAKDFGR